MEASSGGDWAKEKITAFQFGGFFKESGPRAAKIVSKAVVPVGVGEDAAVPEFYKTRKRFFSHVTTLPKKEDAARSPPENGNHYIVERQDTAQIFWRRARLPEENRPASFRTSTRPSARFIVFL